MTNEIVVTFKGKSSQDPWIVVHSEPGQINAALDSITGDLIAKVHATQEVFAAGDALVQIAPPVVAQQAAPLPQQNQDTPAWAEPVQQAAPPQQQSAPPAAGTPEGVQIWTGPQPNKPQYQATFYTIPFIKDETVRKALQQELKDGAWAKAHDTSVKPWVWIAPKGGTEQLVRDTIARYAAQGAFA